MILSNTFDIDNHDYCFRLLNKYLYFSFRKQVVDGFTNKNIFMYFYKFENLYFAV